MTEMRTYPLVQVMDSLLEELEKECGLPGMEAFGPEVRKLKGIRSNYLVTKQRAERALAESKANIEKMQQALEARKEKAGQNPAQLAQKSENELEEGAEEAAAEQGEKQEGKRIISTDPRGQMVDNE